MVIDTRIYRANTKRYYTGQNIYKKSGESLQSRATSAPQLSNHWLRAARPPVHANHDHLQPLGNKVLSLP